MTDAAKSRFQCVICRDETETPVFCGRCGRAYDRHVRECDGTVDSLITFVAKRIWKAAARKLAPRKRGEVMDAEYLDPQVFGDRGLYRSLPLKGRTESSKGRVMASTYDHWDHEQKRYVCGQCYSSGKEEAEIARLHAEVEQLRMLRGEIAKPFDEHDGAAFKPRRTTTSVTAERDAEIARLRAEVERLRRVRDAVTAFLPAHDQSVNDMKPVYAAAFVHGVHFVGRGYKPEIDELRDALRAAEEKERPL